MKATSLFGGVQVLNIIISIIRSKIIAILLGPTGMGITGLLTSTTGLIGSFTNFGLSTSAVKDVASANELGDFHRISQTAMIVRKLVWYTGLLGLIITLIFSPWLSQITFGKKDYTLAYIFLSTTLLFNQLTSGHMVILQGLRHLKYLAKANVSGSLLGLLISASIYYFWGIKGIVPTLILTSLTTLAVASYFGKKIKVSSIKINKATFYNEGKSMIQLGFMISISGLITTATAYIIRIYIGNSGGVNEVGLYDAGFTIIGTYVGLVFSAMITDYYPRLSAVAMNNDLSRSLINQQAEIAILILAPILTIFLVFINWVVVLLYSEKFIQINGMIHWAALGMYFKAASWSVAFIFLAKGASKLYFYNELVANSYLLAINILGYRYGGLDGLGIAFLLCYIIYTLQVFFVARFKYSFYFEMAFLKIIVIQLILAIVCFLSVKFFPVKVGYAVGSFFILLSVIYSFVELNKRLNLKHLLAGITSK